MSSTNWIIATIIALSIITITSAQNCWHIINEQTGQYLQPAISNPNKDNQRHVWLSHNRTDSALWNLVSLQQGNFNIVNRQTGLYLGMPPNEEFAVLRSRSKLGKALSASNYRFRLHDRRGEIVTTAGKTSLYAASCGGGSDGRVKATDRCGLSQCRWRFEGYTCD